MICIYTPLDFLRCGMVAFLTVVSLDIFSVINERLTVCYMYQAKEKVSEFDFCIYTTYQVNVNHGLESISRHSRNGGKEVSCCAYKL